MTYEAALKKVREVKKPVDNFMILEFGYDSKYVLPHSQGVALLAALTNVEMLTDSYAEAPKIIPISRDKLKATPLSREEYEFTKISALLNLSKQQYIDMVEQSRKDNFTEVLQ